MHTLQLMQEGSIRLQASSKKTMQMSVGMIDSDFYTSLYIISVAADQTECAHQAVLAL